MFPELQDIYEVLEKKFNPLQLCQKMSEKFAFIKTKPELAQYEEQLQKLTFLRLIQQLSQVYESMKITDFKNMVSFMDSHTIEKLLVNAVKRRFAGVRIDHQNGAIHFGGSVCNYQAAFIVFLLTLCRATSLTNLETNSPNSPRACKALPR